MVPQMDSRSELHGCLERCTHVVAHFTAAGCQRCTRIRPLFEYLAGRLSPEAVGGGGVAFRVVDVARGADLAAGLPGPPPHFVVYGRDGAVVDTLSGASESALASFLLRWMPPPAPMPRGPPEDDYVCLDDGMETVAW